MNTEQKSGAWFWLRAAVYRAALFFAGWLVLSGGMLSDWMFIALLLAVVVAVSLITVRPGEWRFHPRAVVNFLPWFLRRAMSGGLDVAWRVLEPRPRIKPGLATIPIQGTEKQRLLLAFLVSLLPGTASCALSEDTLVVHCLNVDHPVEEETRELLEKVRTLVD
jgi:multicomponent Na+:H+ antiporter subunit E